MYNRILLKLSGESLSGEQKFGICYKKISDYSLEIKDIVDIGVEVALVVGGGNIYRGSTIITLIESREITWVCSLLLLMG